MSRPRAVRVGRRETRRGVVRFAIPVLLLSAGWLGVYGWRELVAGGWSRHKPVWWLVREVESADAGARGGAWGELLDRLGKGKLSDEQVAQLTRRALDYQLDMNRTWDTAWGHWVEQAEAANRLKPGEWERYLDHGMRAGYKLVARRQVRRGDPLALRLDHAPARLGPNWRFSVMSPSSKVLLLSPDGRVLVDAGYPIRKARGGVKDTSYKEFRVDLTEDRLAALPDGPLVARMTVTGSIYDLRTSVPGKAIPGKVRCETDAAWTLVPADTRTVTLRTDPALRPAVRAAAALRYANYRPDPGELFIGMTCPR